MVMWVPFPQPHTRKAAAPATPGVPEVVHIASGDARPVAAGLHAPAMAALRAFAIGLYTPR